LRTLGLGATSVMRYASSGLITSLSPAAAPTARSSSRFPKFPTFRNFPTSMLTPALLSASPPSSPTPEPPPAPHPRPARATTLASASPGWKSPDFDAPDKLVYPANFLDPDTFIDPDVVAADNLEHPANLLIPATSIDAPTKLLGPLPLRRSSARPQTNSVRPPMISPRAANAAGKVGAPPIHGVHVIIARLAAAAATVVASVCRRTPPNSTCLRLMQTSKSDASLPLDGWRCWRLGWPLKPRRNGLDESMQSVELAETRSSCSSRRSTTSCCCRCCSDEPKRPLGCARGG